MPVTHLTCLCIREKRNCAWYAWNQGVEKTISCLYFIKFRLFNRAVHLHTDIFCAHENCEYTFIGMTVIIMSDT